MEMHSCECEGEGFFHSGVPGILCHVRNGKLAAGAGVERCDLCQRFESDAAALDELVRLGLITTAYTFEDCLGIEQAFTTCDAEEAFRHAESNGLRCFVTEVAWDFTGTEEARQWAAGVESDLRGEAP
jgi:hypothetical protein